MIQNKVIPGYSIQKVLLWENQDPTVARGETTCNLSDDFNKYDEILISYYKTTTDLIEITQKLYPENIRFQVVTDYSSASPSYFVDGRTLCRRIKMPTENNYKQIQFSTGWGMNGGTASSSVLIPIKIYGLNYIIPIENGNIKGY